VPTQKDQPKLCTHKNPKHKTSGYKKERKTTNIQHNAAGGGTKPNK
jgi:hypothetical protein